jgi:tetratricopeptide (TPR) repeat protein
LEAGNRHLEDLTRNLTRQCRRSRYIQCGLGLLVVALLMLGAAQSRDGDFEILTVKHLVFQDRGGKTRVEIKSLPDGSVRQEFFDASGQIQMSLPESDIADAARASEPAVAPAPVAPAPDASAPSYLIRGDAWRHNMEYEKAIANYNEALRLDPRYTLAFRGRGSAWYGKKEYGKAISDYNEAIRLDPEYSMAYYNRAWLWATCPVADYRDGKKAVESATRACELTGWLADNFVDALAAACAETGDFDKAVEWQEKANKLYTDPEKRTKGEERLNLYKDKKPYREP